jgi:transcriptional regulator with XRE-family HTH domain
MTFQELFITNLKRYRKLRKISQLQLAGQCDSSQTYIAEIEVGKKFPSADMIERIARVLEIESYLLFQDMAIKTDIQKTALTPVQKREMADKIHTAVMKIVEMY